MEENASCRLLAIAVSAAVFAAVFVLAFFDVALAILSTGKATLPAYGR
jgi:hypothetical protein